MKFMHLGFNGTLETVEVVTVQTVLCTSHCNAVILFLFPQEFQLLIFRANDCLSAVIFFLVCCNLVSLSSGSQLPVYLSSIVTSLLSLWRSQLPVYLSSVVTSLPSLVGGGLSCRSISHLL